MFRGEDSVRLERIEQKLDQIFRLLNKEDYQMAKLDDEIATLKSDVAAETNATTAAVTLLNGLSTQLQAALAAAAAAGATPAQLQAIADVSTALEAQTTQLASAVTANTPAAPPAAGP